MPSGSAVIRYDGKRGTVWRVKYRDASGRQVQETLGSAQDGWSGRKAEAELRARLTDVRRDKYTKPLAVIFGSFAGEWLEGYIERKSLKFSTSNGYRQILKNHLLPEFGSTRLEDIDVEAIEGFINKKLKQKPKPLTAGTINRCLNLLSLILQKGALPRKLIRENPLPNVERPAQPKNNWRILTPVEVQSVEKAFNELLEAAEDERESDDLVVARRLFLFHIETGCRRGEAAGLRWRSTFLANPTGPVIKIQETWTRHRVDVPKSEAGHRTISLGRKLAAELFEHRGWSSYDSDDNYVFANPRTGLPLHASRYSELMRLALAKAGIEGVRRPSHELRHASITNRAAAGTPPQALMTLAGHSSYQTTQIYIDLVDEGFPEEADRLEERLWGETGTSSGTRSQIPTPTSEPIGVENLSI
jgi:integrase